MNLFWILLATLPFFTNCQEDYDYFIDPSATEAHAELYTDKEGNEYAFFSSKVSWTEAEVLCSTKKGHLVEIIKEEIGIFIAQALSESALGYDALWVGAQYREKEWTWAQRQVAISLPAENSKFPEKNFPYWVEDPTEEKSKDQSCLSLSRWDHDSYLIAPLPCSLERPFICSIPPGGNSSAPQLVPPVIEGDRYRYSLYKADVTWQEAVAFCLDKGTKLASLNFKNTGADSDFMLLSQRMLRSRPVIENAWLNGKFEKDHFKWMWVALNEEISTLEPGDGDITDPGTNDPPWFRGGNIFQQGCLLLDRHLCDKPVFVEAKCERKRSFICQEEKDAKRDKEFENVGDGLWLSNVARPWQSALKRCSQCFNNKGHLLALDGKLADDKMLKEITDGMSKWKSEVRHIWMAGHLSSDADKWNWITDGDDDKPGSEINNQAFAALADKTSNIQVTVDCLTKSVKNLKITAFQCLNMDRENQRHVFFYGLSCNLPQLFFCESDSKDFKCPDDAGPKKNTSEPESTTVLPGGNGEEAEEDGDEAGGAEEADGDGDEAGGAEEAEGDGEETGGAEESEGDGEEAGGAEESDGDGEETGGAEEAEGDGDEAGGAEEAEGDGDEAGGAEEAEGDGDEAGGAEEAEGDGEDAGGAEESEGDGEEAGGAEEAEGDGEEAGGAEEAEGDGDEAGGAEEAEGDGDEAGGAEEAPEGGDTAGDAEEAPEGGDTTGGAEEAPEGGDTTGGAEEAPEGGDTTGDAAEEAPEGGDTTGGAEEAPEGGDSTGGAEEAPEGDAEASTAGGEEAPPEGDESTPEARK